MTLRFADLNPLGRVIIVIVAGLTLAVAAVAFATSYGALYAFIKGTGLYNDTGRYATRLNQAWPLLLDATFIVAQLAAILAGILRGSRGWPILTMLLTGALTVWFNLQHAGSDPGRRLAAALPPVLMMLAFEIDISIVKWVMRALGKPMEAATPLPPTSPPGVLAGPLPGAIWRPDGPGWNVPPAGWPPGPGWVGSRRPPPSGKPTQRTSRPAGWGRRRAGRGDQAGAHRGVPGLAGFRTAPPPDGAGADQRPQPARPGRDRALRQAGHRPAATHPSAAAAGERYPHPAPLSGRPPPRRTR